MGKEGFSGLDKSRNVAPNGKAKVAGFVQQSTKGIKYLYIYIILSKFLKQQFIIPI